MDFTPLPLPSPLSEVFSLRRYFPAASALTPSLAGDASGLGLTRCAFDNLFQEVSDVISWTS